MLQPLPPPRPQRCARILTYLTLGQQAHAYVERRRQLERVGVEGQERRLAILALLCHGRTCTDGDVVVVGGGAAGHAAVGAVALSMEPAGRVSGQMP